MTTTESVFELTVHEAVERIRAHDGTINAYVNTRLDDALTEAESRAHGESRSALAGVPYGLKDEWETLCLPTTAGSWPHRDRRSAEDSAVFQAFDEAGAILVGKTNLSDLGLAPEATNYVVGATRNPWDRRRTAGGSSGGAAAAVAAGMQAFDWGTDIGGSIRQPAAFCGLLGLRLSSETWPISGSFPKIPTPLEWLCGQGPLTRTSAEMRAVLGVAAKRLKTGTDRPFQLRGAVIYAPERPGKWPSFAANVTPHIERALDASVHDDHGLPKTTWVRKVYSALWASHLEALLEADDSLTLGGGLLATAGSLLFRGSIGKKRFHPHCAEIVALVGLGRITIFRSREKALRNAQSLRDRFGELWDRGYLVVSPVSTGPAPLLGGGNRDHSRVILCTGPGNIADATGLSIPFGRFGELPRAIQLLGPPGSEATLLEVADRLIASRDEDPELTPLPWPLD